MLHIYYKIKTDFRSAIPIIWNCHRGRSGIQPDRSDALVPHVNPLVLAIVFVDEKKVEKQ